MIATLFYQLVILVLSGLIAILPDVSALPSGITNAITKLSDSIGLLGWLLPFDTLFQIVTLGLVIEGAIFLFKWVNWIANKIRGSG